MIRCCLRSHLYCVCGRSGCWRSSTPPCRWNALSTDDNRRQRNNQPREREIGIGGRSGSATSVEKKGCTTRTTNVFHWRKKRISGLHGTNLNRIRRGYTVMI